MTLRTPVDREFQIQPRGYVRDEVVLANFREGLREQVNPATGAVFTEDEIRRATRPKSRWYIGAQAIDDLDQGEQYRALYLNDQIRIERASTAWLVDYHGRLEGESFLGATGSSGSVLVRGTPGVIVNGSTTPNHPDAYKARSPSAALYQVFTTTTIGVDGTAEVVMFSIDTGRATNIVAPSTLAWQSRDPSMLATADLMTDFQGGTDRETDAEFASRLASIRRFRQGAGNDAHFRGWARAASNSIEEGWIYPGALYSGTTLVAITEKRAGALGPLGRIPTDFVLSQAIAFLTPPSSATVPGRARVLVTSVTPEPSDGTVALALQRGTAAGWTDTTPWPTLDASDPPHISALTTQTNFIVESVGDDTLPGLAAFSSVSGDAAPAVMVWDESRTRFEQLSIASIADLGANLFQFTLTAPPSFTLTIGDWLSPNIARAAIISQAISNYFDELGPGEIVDQETDVRAGRCVRFPFTDEWPIRIGSVLATRITEALGSSTADADVTSLSKVLPSLPTLVRNGPNMLVAGRFALGEI
jgi:hypothetical protein